MGGTKLGTLSIDNIVINGQSHCYEIDLILFGDLNLYNRDAFFEERVRELSIFYKQLNKNENMLDELFKAIILNLKSQYASEQLIYRKLSVENITVNFITGRRNEYTEKFNDVRTKFLKQTNGHVKIMSYDRVINSINSIE